MSFKVVLKYSKGSSRTLYTNLTEEEAQNITSDPESTWATCTKKHLKRRTKERGSWFLLYTEE